MRRSGKSRGRVHGNSAAPTKLAALAGTLPSAPVEAREVHFSTEIDKEEVFKAVFYHGSETAVEKLTGIRQQTISKWLRDPRNQEMVERVNRESWSHVDPRANALLSGALVSLQHDLAEGNIEPRDKIYMVQVLAQCAEMWANRAKDDTFAKMGNLSPDSMIELHKKQIAVLEEIQRRKNSAIDAEVVSARVPETPRALPDLEDRRAPGPLPTLDPATLGRNFDSDLVREGRADVLAGVGRAHKGSKGAGLPGESDL